MAVGTTLEQPRTIKIHWPKLNIMITAIMTERNPALVNLLFSKLPYRSLQSHALVSGDHLYHLVPAEALIYTHPDHKVPNRALEPDGTVFLSGFQHMAIKYGTLTEDLPAAPCGYVVPEDIEKLKKAGSLLWEACNEASDPIEVIVWDATEAEPKGHIPLTLERTGVTDEVKELVLQIHNETEFSWSGISSDLEIIHQGRATSHAGSKDSYFATMLFINSEIRTLGYYILNNILKTAATQPHFDLEHLISMYRVFVPTPAEFVGYVGAHFLCSTNRKIDAVLTEKVEKMDDQEAAREDFLALMSALAQYVNLLNAQNLQLFPWKHGDEYPVFVD
ncbi:hypothetical protein P170DRAFT_451806 [Aspergillus steynii IBT 23096]|uniref:Cucumopine synthase C-terminal helical bundle domain-containing protein n=1 Tax=Aspergillus steynii IBT 23096 TaxID=1392250 RepID=A0A2I2GLR1_9EURO|nr:uncharacterized protein P170DRAFT_451806 [Aspergillus steynii IBT 23096]PLB53813.1 hypothetical protein P170DRAFT_451806 [Aspergillus steynii IBT 23096]